MLANGVDLDASSGMGAGPMCPVHGKAHGRLGERWERANVESIDLVNRSIDLRGVNELVCLGYGGVN